MADQTDFKHITVNPAESDDVVIHAGAVAESKASAPESGARAASQSTETAPSHGVAHGTESTSGPEPSSEPSDSSKARSTNKDAYRQTTLEDIQGFKMSKTQIAVIVCALAAVAAFVVWYLVFS